MTTLSSYEAKTKFGELLRLVRSGEEVIITWRDQPVARVIPEGRDTLSSRAIVARRILASREKCQVESGADPLHMRDLVNEGRRI